MYLFKPKYKTQDGSYKTSPNWAVEFTHEGKRIVKALGTANKTLASHRAKVIIDMADSKDWNVVDVKIPGNNSKNSLTIDSLVEAYKAFGEEKKLVPLTVRRNVSELRRFAAGCNTEKVESLDVKVFMRSASIQSLSEQTKASIMRKAMSVFCKDALDFYKENGIKVSVPDAKRALWRTKPIQSFIAPSKNTVLKLIEKANTDLKRRDIDQYLAFILAIQTGLRQAEILHLKWADVMEHLIIVRSDSEHRTKSGKSRQVPLDKLISDELEKYRMDNDYVICGDRYACMKRLAAWLRKNGVNEQKPLHYLRKLYGSLVATELGLYAAKEYLGHSTVTVTESYYADLLHTKSVNWGDER